MKHIVSWSGGKDSTATIILAHEHNLPIDLIVISLMYFDKKREIFAEYPEHVEWIKNIAIPMFESWGYPVQIISSDKDYLYWFYHVVTKSPHKERNGKYAGFLLGKGCRMNGEKVGPIRQFLKSYADSFEEYVGIAIDEPERLERLHKKAGKTSLLEKYGYNEKMAREKCEEYGLLSPSYEFSLRGGCWFCPNQSYAELMHLKKDHPDLWQELKKLSNEKTKCQKISNIV